MAPNHVRYLKLISNLVWIHLWLNVGNNYCILSICLFGIVRSSKLYNFIKVFIFTNYLVFPLGGGAQFLWWCAMYFVFGSTTIWVHLWLCVGNNYCNYLIFYSNIKLICQRWLSSQGNRS